MVVHTVGIDLGKTIFHLVAMNDKGEVVGSQKVFPEATAALHVEQEDLFDRDGSLWGRPFLGTGAPRTGA